ncbi:hypothetical protein CCH79_00021097 [Gambusia affinis]|uniref:Uncharacterized protein n=1 Tax=Gambusia affinis TaxID=33528 RepID=A0A315V5E9_GAMAF|nr:hypothetical protein CCH79_00021097 [Gambusia affinis]
MEKEAVGYRSAADLKIIDQREDEVKRLEFELSRKIDDIGILKKEVSHHKDRCRRLEGKTDELEKQLEREEKEKKDILKKLPKPKTEEIIFKSKKEFRAESNSELSALQRQVAAMNMNENKCFDRPESDWRKLKEEIKALNGQVEALIEDRQRDREHTDKLIAKMCKLKDNYYMEKMKEEDLQMKYKDLKKEYEDLWKEYEDLNESKTSKEANVKNDIAVETPTSQSKVDRQTDKQISFLPPIDKRSIRYQTLTLGEGKLVPHFKEDKLVTQGKINQLKPTPPSSRKPEMPSTSTGRKRSLRETKQRKDGGRPGRAA